MKNKSNFCWVASFMCLLTSVFVNCSCTAGISLGKANRIEQTVTNVVDSTVTTFSLTPLK